MRTVNVDFAKYNKVLEQPFYRKKGKSSHNRCCPRTAAIEQESGIGRHVLQDSKVQRKGLSGSLPTGRCGACAL